MNKYTLQRSRKVNETVDEYIVIDDVKLREICDELGIDIDKLMMLRKRVAQWLDGETLHGSIAKAGLPITMQSHSLKVTA